MKLTNSFNRMLKTRVLLPIFKKLLSFSSLESRERGWFRILEKWTGAWQQDIKVDAAVAESYWANFACLTLICSDISKMPLGVREFDPNKQIWKKTQVRNQLFKVPNHYQTFMEFVFAWVMSELRTGNTYVLKVRDPQTTFVKALYVLDPCRVTPYITSDGGVYYKLNVDELSQIFDEDIYVPATEVIHDRMYPLYHPLIGLPPLFACGVQAMQGHSIIGMSTTFFGNRGMPAGILTAPGHIPDDTAARLKTYFDENFTGENAGKVAVLGDNLKFESLGAKASDSQLIEQLRMTAEMIAACYHVPGYKIGVGATPSVNNTAALNQQYYDQCLHYIIAKMEYRFDDGLEIKEDQQCWFDIAELLRMDPQTKSAVLGQRVKDSIISTNEARREDDLEPVEGGDTPMIQQQNYSLAALSRRDNQAEESLPAGQITSIQTLLTAVASGELPLETARAMIAAAYPTLSTDQINAMLEPLKEFEALAPEPTTPVAPEQTSPADNEGKAMLVSIMEQLSEMQKKMVSRPPDIEEEFVVTQEDIEEARNMKLNVSLEVAA